MPKILVVVPVYNQNLLVFSDCLSSINNQTFKDFRCVVVDDGSPNYDEIKNITEIYGFEYIYQNNGGIGSSRNTGIQQLKDEMYLTYLSSDDVWDPDYLKEVYDAAQEHPDTIIYTNTHITDQNLNIIQTTNYKNFNSQEEFIFAVIGSAKNHQMFINYSTTLFPAKYLKETYFWEDKRYGEDLSHVIECAVIKKYPFYCVEKPLLRYRTGPLSTTNKEGLSKNITENNYDTFRRINKMVGWDVL